MEKQMARRNQFFYNFTVQLDMPWRFGFLNAILCTDPINVVNKNWIIYGVTNSQKFTSTTLTFFLGLLDNLYLINNIYYLQTWHCDKCKHDIFLAARMSEKVGEVSSILYLLQENVLKTTYSRKEAENLTCLIFSYKLSIIISVYWTFFCTTSGSLRGQKRVSNPLWTTTWILLKNNQCF